jgi:formyltetrahydrofolate-dependent phosphoribosylglycinamide formyltransferase
VSVRVAVLASGSGTNLQSLLDHFRHEDAAARIALVVSDKPDARALDRAREAGVATAIIPVSGRAEADVVAETSSRLDEEGIELVALAGYMRLVPREVVQRYAGRIINIHPALLPAFGGRGMYGQRVHRAVLESGCRVTGVTVHHVTENYDEGAPIAQWPVPVYPDDTVETLRARVLATEHVIYPLALEAVARSIAGAARIPTESPVSFAGSGSAAPPAGDVRGLVFAARGLVPNET